MCSMLFGFSEYLGGSGGLDTAHADIEMLSLQIVSLQIVEVGGKRVTVCEPERVQRWRWQSWHCLTLVLFLSLMLSLMNHFELREM